VNKIPEVAEDTQFVGWGPDEESLRDFNKGLALIGLKKS
jgi:hypothetical protein